MTGSTRILFYTPTFEPVGGVVKIFDYANHARELGFDVHLVCPKPLTDECTIWGFEQFADLLSTAPISDDLSMPLAADDVAFISWPTHYINVSRSLPLGFNHRRVIHIVQNVRHGNPTWIDGYAVRLLGRPMTRIMISDEVDEACRPWLNRRSNTTTILEGHRCEYFSHQCSGAFGSPLRVGYMTWKSEVGVEVEGLMAGEDGYEFRSIRGSADWSQVRELYHWADVILGCPGPEEGFYLVGLEAMAAGAVLIMSDAVGNRAYARWGENCVKVEHDHASDYVDALHTVRSWPTAKVDSFRQAGYSAIGRHTLERERLQFGDLLQVHVLAADIDSAAVLSG